MSLFILDTSLLILDTAEHMLLSQPSCAKQQYRENMLDTGATNHMILDTETTILDTLHFVREGV